MDSDQHTIQSRLKMTKVPNMASSPPSAGTRTHYGSPSTNPTVMSPDCGIAVPSGSSPAAVFGSLANTTIAARRNLAVPSVTVPGQLSPTAEEFTPGVPTTTFALQPANARVGRGGNMPRSVLGGTAYRGGPGVIGQPLHPNNFLPLAQTSRPQCIRQGKFSTDEKICRAFVVTGLYTASAANFQYIAITYRHFESLVNIDAQSLHAGLFAVQFNNVEEAKQAVALTNSFVFRHDNIQCFFQTPKDIAKASGADPDFVSNHQAEYLINVVDLGQSTEVIDYKLIINALNKCGEVKAFATVPSIGGAHVTYRVEFYDARVNVNQLSGALISGFRICVEPHTPDVVRRPSLGNPLDDPVLREALMGFYQPKRQNLLLSPAANHNVVDIMKILLGQDVRTTIMLRNIPNRVDQAALKDLLDKTSKGQYDFMYLRIDFANNCNVGYAFINFVDPMAIIPFADAHSGQKWNLFQSEKVAEISYATIQGRDCLVQKFRNSSVMLEREEFRPKLYKTGDGPDAGTEEPFPAADNESKLRRSLDNAETVGLYHSCSRSGPIPVKAIGNTVPPPRNQLPGGVYQVPAETRIARTVNYSIAVQAPPTYIPRYEMLNPDPANTCAAVDYMVKGCHSKYITYFEKP